MPFQFPKLKNLSPTAKRYFGYDALPSYVYGKDPIHPATTLGTAVPWINLDEKTQLGLDQIYAGVASANTQGPGNQLLFLAKANRAEFDYLAPLGWWNVPRGNVPFSATKQYIQQQQASPSAGSTQYVSFPNGTIELKAAWRKLAPTEDASRFYTKTALLRQQQRHSSVCRRHLRPRRAAHHPQDPERALLHLRDLRAG